MGYGWGGLALIYKHFAAYAAFPGISLGRPVTAVSSFIRRSRNDYEPCLLVQHLLLHHISTFNYGRVLTR